MAILLLLATVCSATSLPAWLHVTLDHAHHDDTHHDDRCPGEHGPVVKDAHAAHDPHDCRVCAALHAPMMPVTLVHASVQMRLAAERAITLQVQRMDDSVPARRGCRGPPLT